MAKVCAGCWRAELLTAHESGLELCGQCTAQVDQFAKDGAGSEGGKHAARLLAVWGGRTEAREAYELEKAG